MKKTERKKASKKGLILQRAATMFRERGFAASSMRDLAETVGIEAASLYNHIRSKNEILESISFEVANLFNEKLQEVESNRQSTINKIESILRFHIEQMIDNYEKVIVCDREWRHLDEPFRANFQSQRRSYRKRFAAILEEGIAKGEIRRIDAPTAVLVMLHAVNGIESWHRSKTKISADELSNHMIRILIDGLRKAS
jgi:AcrR family transcriptional regulator